MGFGKFLKRLDIVRTINLDYWLLVYTSLAMHGLIGVEIVDRRQYLPRKQ